MSSDMENLITFTCSHCMVKMKAKQPDLFVFLVFFGGVRFLRFCKTITSTCSYP